MLEPHAFAGTYLVIACLCAAHSIIIALVQLRRSEQPRSFEKQRPLLTIMRSSAFVRALLPAVSFHACMSGLMSVTPLLVKTETNSLPTAANVLTVHIVAMYAPSLVVPLLLKRIPQQVIVTVGGILFLGGNVAFFFANGSEYVALFYVALALIGLGWNLAFVSSTALLPKAIAIPGERFKVQTANDVFVFGVGSAVTLASGAIAELPNGFLGLLIGASCWIFVAMVVAWLCIFIDTTGKKELQLQEENRPLVSSTYESSSSNRNSE